VRFLIQVSDIAQEAEISQDTGCIFSANEEFLSAVKESSQLKRPSPGWIQIELFSFPRMITSTLFPLVIWVTAVAVWGSPPLEKRSGLLQ
jgi:hypothetical protein